MTSTSTDRRHGVNADAAVKVPCKAATTANITLSGAQTVDGVALVTDDRCLVKNQTTGADNGIYVVDSGAWSRSLDWDGAYDAKNGSLVYVTDGSTYADNLFTCTTSDPITIGTTSVAFAILSTGNPLTLPLSLAQGGTAQTTKAKAAAALGVVVLTGAGGTANAQTAGAPANYTAFATSDLFVYVPSVSNTLATTLTITPSGGSALAAKNVFCGGSALVGNELVANAAYILQNDGTQLNIVSGLPTADSRTMTLTNKTITGAATGSSVKIGTGSGTGTHVVVANVQTTTVGNVGGGTDDLMSYTLPANSLSAVGKVIRITAFGRTANNANAKTLTLAFGSSTNGMVMSTGALHSWEFQAYVTKTGSNTQQISVVVHESAASLSTTLIAVNTPISATETDTSAITVKFTAAATADNDITQNYMLVEFLN